MRRHVRLEPAYTVADPGGPPARRLMVDVGAAAQVETMCVAPPDPAGLLLYFIGFDVALGGREELKCRVLAHTTGFAVVTSEIAGFARSGDPLPAGVRHDLYQGDSAGLAAMVRRALELASVAAGVADLRPVHVLAYSTGCSLAVHAARDLADAASMTLVEPVAVEQRNIVTLQVANTVDLVRYPQALMQNHRLAKDVRRSRMRVRFGLPDLLALATTLSSDELPHTRTGRMPVSLVRGGESWLCPPGGFAHLAATLAAQEIAGITATIPHLGHQLWNSVPAVAAIAEEVVAPTAAWS